MIETALRKGSYVGIATHDEKVVWHGLRLIHQLGLEKNQYEFQMLLGVDEQHARHHRRSRASLRVYVPFGKHWYALLRSQAERESPYRALRTQSDAGIAIIFHPGAHTLTTAGFFVLVSIAAEGNRDEWQKLMLLLFLLVLMAWQAADAEEGMFLLDQIAELHLEKQRLQPAGHSTLESSGRGISQAVVTWADAQLLSYRQWD